MGVLRQFLFPAIEAMVVAPIILIIGRLVYSISQGRGGRAVFSEVFEIVPLILIFVALFVVPQIFTRMFVEAGKGPGPLFVVTSFVYVGLVVFLLAGALFDESGVFVAGDWKYVFILMTAAFVAAMLTAYRHPT